VSGEPVFAGEEDLIANAVPQRRQEFVTARRCAREALGRLGITPAAIGRGPERDPRWPSGIAGSITHCPGYRAAAVAPITAVAGVGIDAETHAPLPAGVGRSVTVPSERAMLAAMARTDPGVCWDRLLFSAKESIYKAWYPVTGRRLGFREALVTFDPAAGVFQARLPTTCLIGRYLVERGLAVTAVVVAAG
jgi:4'-phosphopantetheinyl transferase EntD